MIWDEHYFAIIYLWFPGQILKVCLTRIRFTENYQSSGIIPDFQYRFEEIFMLGFTQKFIEKFPKKSKINSPSPQRIHTNSKLGQESNGTPFHFEIQLGK
jgi:hypothetical protein